MKIASIDHVVLTVADMDRTIDFYTRVLGMRLETFGEGRKALAFGAQKLNLQDGKSKADVVAVARVPTPGSVDLCFLAGQPLDEVMAELAAQGVPIEIGPVRRTGARFPIRSVYVRDPDGNLIEIAEPWQD
ncbi:MAG: VOC family protein [Burkholderiales bacterium]|nr:VOC family protein [Burkholderiales bacterium]